MNPFKKAIILIAIPLLVWGCEKAKMAESKRNDVAQTETYDITNADSATVSFNGNTLQRMGIVDSARKFVVTADMKFRVKNVVNSTYAIEELTINTGGFVTLSELRSNQNHREVIAVSPDSSLESIVYTIENSMIIRVPKTNLDSFLRGIGKEVDYFDYRIIKADDVGLGLLENTMRQKRLNTYEKQQQKNIDEKGRKLSETSYEQEDLLNKQMQADENLMQKLKLEDDVRYSTVSISIYQKESVSRVLVANYKNIKAYEPGFGKRLLHALGNGWGMFENLVVALANMWAFLVVIVLVFIAYRRFGAKLKKKE